MPVTTRIPKLLKSREAEILKDWIDEQMRAATGRSGVLTSEAQVTDHSRRFLGALQAAAQAGGFSDGDGRPEIWQEVHEVLEEVSRSRARQGSTPTQTAMFVFSLKQPLFDHLRQDVGADAEALVNEIWLVSTVLDRLGLYTTEVFQKSREDIILRHQQEMLELSTPVVELWEGVLALPLIGTLDSERTQIVMENLLKRIVETGAGIAIIDITGVPTVDTLVAQHLLKTVAAARLMGADCIISGIRPQIAQTIVHLGVDLGNVITKATVADAFMVALSRAGLSVSRPRPAA